MGLKLWFGIALGVGIAIYFGLTYAGRLPPSIARFLLAMVVMAVLGLLLLLYRRKAMQDTSWN